MVNNGLARPHTKSKVQFKRRLVNGLWKYCSEFQLTRLLKRPVYAQFWELDYEIWYDGGLGCNKKMISGHWDFFLVSYRHFHANGKVIIAHKSRKKDSMSGNNFFYYTLVLHHTKFHTSTLKIKRWRGVLGAVSVEIRNIFFSGHLPAYVWQLCFETLCGASLRHYLP